MIFFSGFSLKNEENLFSDYIDGSEYSICGFSYGAISALHRCVDMIDKSQRVDKLVLLSPAFFQTKDEKFKRLQLMSYKKSTLQYIKDFRRACFSPYPEKKLESVETDISELKELLEYEWSLKMLQKVVESGVVIEVYLGSKDAIIDVEGARELFLKVATLTYIKDANHFLQIN